MPKNFDLKEIKKQILKEEAEKISKNGFEIKCPKCKAKLFAYGGENICPKCGTSIDFSVNIKD